MIEKSLGIIIPIWIETPSIIGLYHFYINLFEKYLWKHSVTKWIGLPKIPNLNGKWKAVIKSSHNHATKNADVFISQSYSKFSMILKTDESTSITTMAHLELGNPIYRTLTYSFISKPRPLSAASMNVHEGTANLEILKNDTALRGYYYSGRGRQNFGEILLEKEGAK